MAPKIVVELMYVAPMRVRRNFCRFSSSSFLVILVHFVFPFFTKPQFCPPDAGRCGSTTRSKRPWRGTFRLILAQDFKVLQLLTGPPLGVH
jgi:hypothetical protein